MVNPQLASAIEKLDYQVTVGEVAARAGLEINTAQSGLLALASDVGANLRVTESGEVAYLFPQNYRSILRNKYVRLRFQEFGQKVWNVLFYLIRISFGIFLVVSILLIFAAIAVIVISTSNSEDNDRRRNRGSFNIGSFFWVDDLFWWFTPSPRTHQKSPHPKGMNFFEAVFSVLFGDGNPNSKLEDRRWQTIGTVIRQHQGAIAAEQIMPYLDLPAAVPDEDFMIPVLSRFNGYPHVTEQGELVYHFPELQTTAVQRQQESVAPALQESLWDFSQASSAQIMWTVGLGVLNLGGALILQSMLNGGAIAIGGFVGFVGSILWLLLAYGIGFLVIPLGRYLWIQRQNQRIQARNEQRMQYASILRSPSPTLTIKLHAAEDYRNESVVSHETLAYTTEKDLLEQTFESSSG